MQEKRFLEAVYLAETPPRRAYYSVLPAVRWLAVENRRLAFPADVTFFAGENGTGKSTLLEAIAVAAGFNAEGGTRNFHFSTAATHSGLHEQLNLVRGRRPRDGFFLRAESFYNVATNIDQLEREGPGLLQCYGGVSLHEQSHGESFFALMRNRFRPQGLYLLDEPEAALSPTRQLAMLALLHELCGQGAQFVIATHSPILLAYPDACIYQFSEDGITRVTYRETENYILTRRFLDDPDMMLRQLFREET